MTSNKLDKILTALKKIIKSCFYFWDKRTNRGVSYDKCLAVVLIGFVVIFSFLHYFFDAGKVNPSNPIPCFVMYIYSFTAGVLSILWWDFLKILLTNSEKKNILADMVLNSYFYYFCFK